MNKLQGTIKQLQMNLSEIHYDLMLKERQAPDIYGSIECEMVWKRHRKALPSEDDEETSTVHSHDNDALDYSTTGTPPPSTPSPTSYEPCLPSFLAGHDSLTSTANKDERLGSADARQKLLSTKRFAHPTTVSPQNNSNKKRRCCASCGKC